MWGEIIVGAIALIGTLGSAVIANRKTSALFDYRLEKLEHYTEKHDELVERTIQLEKDSALLEQQMKYTKHKIEDMDKRNE